MTIKSVSNLVALYGSGPRQRLEIARMKLRRIESDGAASPDDVAKESAKLRREIKQLETELQNPNPLPPAA